MMEGGEKKDARKSGMSREREQPWMVHDKGKNGETGHRHGTGGR